MKNIKFLLTLVLCLFAVAANAQKRVSGRVWSKADGPIVMAYVVEQDKNNRNVTAAQTDANGNFSMVIKNPANRLRVSYIGYQTKIVPIGGNSHFNIELIDKNTFKTAEVSVTRNAQTVWLFPNVKFLPLSRRLIWTRWLVCRSRLLQTLCRVRLPVSISFQTPVTLALVLRCVFVV